MAGPLELLPNTTIANYAYGAWDGVTQNNACFALFKDQAMWDYDQGGINVQGPVEAGRINPIISAPGQDLTQYLTPKQRWLLYTMPWGEITNPFVVDLGALRRNSGPQALVKIRETEIPASIRDVLYADGGLWHQILQQNIAAPTGTGALTGLPMGGLPSLLLAPSSTDLRGEDNNVYSGSAVTAANRGACPGTGSQTYAGLSMAPVGSNGASTGGLPGVDGVERDAWTPGLVNTTSTAWSGSANVASNVLIWAQYAVNRARRISASDPTKRPSVGIMSYDHFQFLGIAVANKQTIMVTGQGNKSTAVQNPSLGVMDDAIPHAGLLWRWDENMPAATSYVLNFKQSFGKIQPLFAGIEGNGNPLKKSGEDAGIIEVAQTYDPIRRQWLITSTIPGQVIFNPRYQVRCGAYA